jgi:hypothetical protein
LKIKLMEDFKMKKFMLGIAAALLILVGSSMGFAATTSGSFQLVITITTATVDIVPPGPYVNFNDAGVGLSADVVSGGTDPTTGNAGVLNVGSSHLDYSVTAAPSADATTAGWLQSTDGTVAAANTYAIYGIFTDPNRTGKATVDFGSEDLLTVASKTASDTVLALNTEDAKWKGVDVPTGQYRNLFFRLKTPATVPGSGQLGIDMTISAAAH